MESIRNNRIIKKKYIQFFIAMVISVLFLQVTTIIDTIIVGRLLGTGPMSGVRVSSPIINIVNVVALLISAGMSIIMSIALGKRNIKRASSSFTLGFVLCISIGAIISLIGLFLSNNIVDLLVSDNGIKEYAITYTKIVLTAGPFYILASYMGYVVRCDGYARLSMISLASGGISNVICDIIFIQAFKMGVSGAAIATDMSFIVSTIIGASYFFRKNRNIHFVNIFKKDNENMDILKHMFKNGAPSATRIALYTLSLFFINYIVGAKIGTIGIATLTVCSNIGLLSSIVFQSSGASMMPIMGVLFGERDYKGIKLLFIFVLKFMAISVIFLTIIVIALADVLFSLFGVKNLDSSYINVLRFYSIGFVFEAISYVLIFYLSGLQKPKLALLSPLINYVVLTIPMYLIFTDSLNINIIWVSYLIAGGLSLIICYFVISIYKKKKNYESLFLLPKESSDLLLDFSILASNLEASRVSTDVLNILKNNNIDEFKANKCALILEEMIYSTKNFKQNEKIKVYIDIRVLKNEGNILISLRSNGYPFDPSLNLDDDLSLKLINNLSIKLKHNQVIGLNQTIIEV